VLLSNFSVCKEFIGQSSKNLITKGFIDSGSCTVAIQWATTCNLDFTETRNLNVVLTCMFEAGMWAEAAVFLNNMKEGTYYIQEAVDLYLDLMVKYEVSNYVPFVALKENLQTTYLESVKSKVPEMYLYTVAFRGKVTEALEFASNPCVLQNNNLRVFTETLQVGLKKGVPCVSFENLVCIQNPRYLLQSRPESSQVSSETLSTLRPRRLQFTPNRT